MVAFIVAQAALEKFGGDSLKELKRNHDGYIGRLSERLGD
jgi:chorismate synthase